MDEIIELYTPSGRPSRRTIRRGEASPAGLFFPVVCVWAIDEEGCFLVTLRDPAKKASPLKWENPGGACRAGESLIEGAAREFSEETGIQVRPEELSLFSKMTQYGCLVMTYVTRIPRQPVILQQDETCDYKWVSREELLTMVKNKSFADPIEKQILSYKRKLLGLAGKK